MGDIVYIDDYVEKVSDFKNTTTLPRKYLMNSDKTLKKLSKFKKVYYTRAL